MSSATTHDMAPLPVQEPGAFYRALWTGIRELEPRTVLLRGPAHLHPAQPSSGTSDIDIFVPANFAAVRAYLEARGFYRVFKPHTYLERYQLPIFGIPQPYTIDLFKAERWGLGFRLATDDCVPAEPRLACLVHAAADGKGTQYFERKQSGPPWAQKSEGIPQFGPWGRLLWRVGNPGLLTLYLLVTGTIRPEPGMILRNLCRRALLRAWQCTGKQGLEVALLGVDGTGKSTLANALLRLPAAVKVIYMGGAHDFKTWCMRFLVAHGFPEWLRKPFFRYEMIRRRMDGWLSAKRGWVVIYDRHPAEQLAERGSFRHLVRRFLGIAYAWPVDMTFWLTGDYFTLQARKREFPAAELQALDQRYLSMLENTGASFERIDACQFDADSAAAIVGEWILAELRRRMSLDNAPGPLRALLR